MSDSQGPKAKGRTLWQQQEPSTLPEQPDNTPANEQTEQEQQSEPRPSLIENASEFLKNESIRDAPVGRKKLFLESKGLTKPVIDNLLEIQPPPKADATEQDSGRTPQEPSQSTPPTTSPNASKPSAPDQEPPPTTTPPPKDQPPIITYPEFLLHAQKPRPLITATRLLTTLYVASGAAAAVYGTGTYVVEPMVSRLTAARRSLLEGAGANLDALNGKLAGAVSTVPEQKARGSEKGEEDEDAESTGSDGARFFRRSAGTQTSPRRSRSDSSSSASVEAGEVVSPAQRHTSALLGIQGKLSDLVPKDGEPRNPLRDSIYELRAYLQKLPYANSLHLAGKAGRKGEVEAVANVKTEIKGVKGVLLSARNFPSGVAAR